MVTRFVVALRPVIPTENYNPIFLKCLLIAWCFLGVFAVFESYYAELLHPKNTITNLVDKDSIAEDHHVNLATEVEESMMVPQSFCASSFGLIVLELIDFELRSLPVRAASIHSPPPEANSKFA